MEGHRAVASIHVFLIATLRTRVRISKIVQRIAEPGIAPIERHPRRNWAEAFEQLPGADCGAFKIEGNSRAEIARAVAPTRILTPALRITKAPFDARDLAFMAINGVHARAMTVARSSHVNNRPFWLSRRPAAAVYMRAPKIQT